MFASVKIQVKPEEIIEAVKGMEKRKREAFLEDLLAATSPEYLKSIREARADYRARRVRTHEEVPRALPVGLHFGREGSNNGRRLKVKKCW